MRQKPNLPETRKDLPEHLRKIYDGIDLLYAVDRITSKERRRQRLVLKMRYKG